MSRSENLSRADMRRVFRIVGDCRDVGNDRAVWMERAIVGLREELRALVVIGSLHGDLGDIRRGVPWEFWDFGWRTGSEREQWLALLATDNRFSYPTVRGIYRRPAKLAVRSREQLVPDREWRLCNELNEDRRPLGQDETLLGLNRMTAAPVLRQVFSVNRAVGERRFGRRDRAFLRVFLEEIDHLAGSRLAIDDAGPFARLPPRLRQVLDAILDGEGEKQVAARLGISRHTVHAYITALYRRFDVGSRGELHAVYRRLQRPT